MSNMVLRDASTSKIKQMFLKYTPFTEIDQNAYFSFLTLLMAIAYCSLGRRPPP